MTAEEQMEELRRAYEELQEEVRELRRQAAAPPRPAEPPRRGGSLSRRSLLLGAGAAAAGAAAGLVRPSAAPALASDGQAVIAGQSNTDTTTTAITGSVVTGPALRASNYYGGAFDNYSDALQAYTYGAGLAAMYGRNDAAGGTGVYGYSASGVGGTFSGGLAPVRLQPAQSAGPPTSFNHQQGELYLDANGALWLCTQSGTPTTVGTFVQLGGSGSGGSSFTSEVVANVSPPGSYAQTILADSPVLYYRLDEASGTVAGDSSGNGHVGTYQSGASLSQTPGATADNDTAIKVSGSSLLYTSGAGLPSGAAARSVEWWMKTAAGQSIGTTVVWSYGSGSGAESPASLVGFITTSATSVTAYGTGGGSWTLNTALNDGSWHHYLLAYDGSSYTLYQDGVSLGARAQAVSTPANTPLCLGDKSTALGSFPFTGYLDEFAVYASALSSTRVAAHYSAATGSASGTLLYEGKYNNATVWSVDGAGEMRANGLSTALVTRTTGYSATAADSVIIANAAGLTITLPSASGAGAGRQYTVKNGPSGTNTTVTASGGTVDGVASQSIASAFGCLRLVSDGSNWFSI